MRSRAAGISRWEVTLPATTSPLQSSSPSPPAIVRKQRAPTLTRRLYNGSEPTGYAPRHLWFDRLAAARERDHRTSGQAILNTRIAPSPKVETDLVDRARA